MTKDEIVWKAMQTFEDSDPQLPYDGRWKLAFDAVWEDLRALAAPTSAGCEFANELGNRIKITIEGPHSVSENVLTPVEFQKLKEALAAAEANTCPYDRKPCHLGDDEEGYFRCGTVQCGRSASPFKETDELCKRQHDEIAALTERITTLEQVLTDARGAIASLDEDALGFVEQEPHHHWPIRDELLSKTDVALASTSTPAGH